MKPWSTVFQASDRAEVLLLEIEEGASLHDLEDDVQEALDEILEVEDDLEKRLKKREYIGPADKLNIRLRSNLEHVRKLRKQLARVARFYEHEPIGDCWRG